MSKLAEEIRDRIDIATYISRYVDIRKHGTSYKGLCPFHSERTGSFAVTPDKRMWKCFGACNESGDVIGFAMKFHNWTYQEALHELAREAGIDPETGKRQHHRTPIHQHAPKLEDPATPPPAAWQQHAAQVSHRAELTLWSERGRAALEYLRGRGLSDWCIKEARLGYVPADNENHLKYGRAVHVDWLKPDGKPVRVPCGITIPHFADRHLWALRVRCEQEARDKFNAPKYAGTPGGAKALYWSDNVKPGCPIIITEGEFDALIMWQIERGFVTNVYPVSIASASNKRINPRWYPRLISAPVLLVRFDTDKAGTAAIGEMQKLTRAVRVVNVPIGKDINDLFQLRGKVAVLDWIEAEAASAGIDVNLLEVA